MELLVCTLPDGRSLNTSKSRILRLRDLQRSARGPNRLIIPGQALLRFEGIRMSTLEEITKEKQRVSEALARVDAQREKLTGQLSELEATERVLARYSKGRQAKKTASAKMPTMEGAAPARSRGRPSTTPAKPADGKRSLPS